MLERVHQDTRGLKQVFNTSKRHWTTGSALRKEWREAQQDGRKIVLDDFGPPVPEPGPGEPAADFSPRPM